MNIEELYRLYCEHPIVTTDSRTCAAGSIYFALRGESFDGNRFAADALQKGCAYAVVDNADYATDERCILVADALQTLQELASHHRRALGLPVLQITGSNGKTTTKELCAAVLSQRYRTRFTQGNLNNHIGVPRTLLSLTAEDEMAVVETGANHPGEIAELSQIVDPDCGLITNVGRVHLEGFGSIEGVLRTKAALYDYLRQKRGTFVFLHGDNAMLTDAAKGLRTFTYGQAGKDYDVEGEVVGCNPFLLFRWRPRGGEWQEVQTQLIGAYNIDNALAACAVGLRFGVPTEKISEAIGNYRPTNSRSELRRTERNTLIVDAYNANPTSMKAALENFRQIDAPKKVAILGAMGELGATSGDDHAQLVALADSLRLDDLWLVGEAFAPFAESHRVFSNVDAAKAALQEKPFDGALIFIKGSHSTRLYELPALL